MTGLKALSEVSFAPDCVTIVISTEEAGRLCGVANCGTVRQSYATDRRAEILAAAPGTIHSTDFRVAACFNLSQLAGARVSDVGQAAGELTVALSTKGSILPSPTKLSTRESSTSQPHNSIA